MLRPRPRKTDSLARAARAAGPDRRTIELVVAQHQERDLLAARQLDVASAALLARDRESAAKAQVDGHEAAIAQAREVRDRARDAHSRATSTRPASWSGTCS